jgi:multiple sugar transport system substrate-binding protein
MEGFMMGAWRKVPAVSVLAAIGLVTAACGGKAQPDANPPDEKVNKQPIELVFYGGQSNWTDEMFWALFGNHIQKKFPHITPKFISNTSSKLKDLVAVGETIDLMLVTTSGTKDYIINYGFQTDLSPYIKELNIDLNRFDPTIIAAQRDMANGGIYGIPVFVQIPILFYNRDLFDKFGVEYPKAGQTWDEMYETARKLNRLEDGVKYYGLFVMLVHQLKTSQIPLTLIDRNTNRAVYNQDTKRVLENFLRFHTIPGFEYSTSMNQETMFFKDKTLAMWPHFTNLARRMPDTLNWDAAPMPYYPEAYGVAPAADPYYLFITSTSKHKKEAVEVAAFLTEPEAQKELAKEGFTPIIRDKEIQAVFGQNNKNYAGKNVSAFFSENLAPAPPYHLYYSLVDTTLISEFNNAAQGQKDLNTALRDYEEAANKKIAEAIAMEK